MRQVWLGIALLALMWGPAAAQDGVGGAARSVITAQIEALRADDFETAFSYASPAIKEIFGDPQRFGQMVRQGYPMVYRPAELKFLEASPTGKGMRQRVMVTDAKGAIHVLAYDMIQVNGIWQIDGVQLLDAEQIGA